jgi:hypothetical protein
MTTNLYNGKFFKKLDRVIWRIFRPKQHISTKIGHKGGAFAVPSLLPR